MNKKIIIVLALVVVIGGGFMAAKVLSNNDKKSDKPKITFKENIVFIKNQKSFSEVDENNEVIVENLPVILPNDIIIEKESHYDEISFNKIGTKDTPMTLEFNFIDTSSVGENFTGTLYVRLKDTVEEVPFTYSVIEKTTR
ncbi:hypothetical protein H9L01_07235 [Erysipelothrix inopinata]|uniref:Uncharacterized protein n=1 Tax=Erysipelothrix inopinata TaxID=225084 RepID=A0A7G9RX35_9FIRM|nr:hypothetical protein [Erysipelothrix inopinata]QNN60160.1 hypothetical protein H9L01_07235 [Erysipelothrix inopinata]